MLSSWHGECPFHGSVHSTGCGERSFHGGWAFSSKEAFGGGGIPRVGKVVPEQFRSDPGRDMNPCNAFRNTAICGSVYHF